MAAQTAHLHICIISPLSAAILGESILSAGGGFFGCWGRYVVLHFLLVTFPARGIFVLVVFYYGILRVANTYVAFFSIAMRPTGSDAPAPGASQVGDLPASQQQGQLPGSLGAVADLSHASLGKLASASQISYPPSPR